MAEARIVKLTSAENADLYPVTTGAAVKMSGDKTLDQVFQEKTTALQTDYTQKLTAIQTEYAQKTSVLQADYEQKAGALGTSLTSRVTALESWKTLQTPAVTTKSETTGSSTAVYTLPDLSVGQVSAISEYSVSYSGMGIIRFSASLKLPSSGTWLVYVPALGVKAGGSLVASDVYNLDDEQKFSRATVSFGSVVYTRLA